MDVAIFGNIVADVIGEPMDPVNFPAPGSLTLLNSIVLSSGGSVCNVGIALSRLGMIVGAAGMVGDDLLGSALVEQLSARKIDVSAVAKTDRAQTSTTIVACHPDGQRTFFHAPGVTTLLDADAFRNCFDLFRQCAWLHIGYFGLLPALTPVLPQVLAELKQTAPGLKISLDTLNPPGEWKQLLPILSHVDLFAPSRIEGIALSRERDPKKMIAFFRQAMPQGLIGIKLDQDGCLLDDSNTQVAIPAFREKVVDTTGAGDCWFAGLLLGLREKMPLERCGQLANRVAADCCSMIGASTGVQSLKETLERL